MTWALFQAITLLAQLGMMDLPRVELADRPPTSERGRTTQAFVRWTEDDRTVYVLTTSRAYRTAVRGDVRPLAALIAHERVHLLNGPNERPAYDEQLRVLRVLRVGRSWIQRAEEARSRESR